MRTDEEEGRDADVVRTADAGRDAEERDTEEREAETARDTAGRELRLTLLIEPVPAVALRVGAELRTADELRVEGLVAYLVDIPPLLLSLEPKCTGSPRCP